MKENAIVSYDEHGYNACMSKALKKMGLIRIFDSLGNSHWIKISYFKLPMDSEWAKEEMLYPEQYDDVAHIGGGMVIADGA